MYIYFASPILKKSPIVKIVKKQLCKREIEILEILKTIDFYCNYFFIFDTFRPLFMNTTETNYMTLEYKNVELCPLELYTFSIKNLVHAYKHLCYSISLLLSKKLVHMSINLTNIAFEDTHPYILGFNSALYVENFNNFNLLKFDGLCINEYLPPELHFVSYIQSNKIEILKLNDIYKVCIEFGSIENSIETLVKYFEKFANKTANDIIHEIFMNYVTFDNYSLSKIFLFIIKDEKCDFFDKFSEILLENTHFDFTKRLSIEETINKFNKIWF